MMSIVYVDEQGAALHRHGETILVEKDSRIIAKIPLAQLDELVIVGNISITTPVMAFLLDQAIPTAFITSHGRYRGRLSLADGKNAGLRIAQFERYQDADYCLRFSKMVVVAKIANLVDFLRHHARNHPDSEVGHQADRIGKYLRSVRHAESRESLRGVEGAAAAQYFAAFGKLVRMEFRFTKRSRRPPRDPINALLSLGYTLLARELVAAVSAVGLDPAIGFYHEIDYGRPSLAIDLLEEFRFLADSLAIALVNKGMLNRHDFENADGGGIYLSEKGREIFFREYEAMMRRTIRAGAKGECASYRRMLFNQTQRLASAIKTQIAYRPFHRSCRVYCSSL